MNSTNFSLPNHLSQLYNVLGSLSKEISHWFNHGKFSIYDLIEYVLIITGPADIKVTSFSISEEAISRFNYFLKSGMVREGKFIFDHSTSKSKFDLLLYLSKTYSVTRTNNHTKIILISNEQYHITISSSANLNQNRRHENGFAATDLVTFHLFEEYFDTIYNRAIPVK